MIESEINIGCLSPPIVDDPLRLRSKKKKVFAAAKSVQIVQNFFSQSEERRRDET